MSGTCTCGSQFTGIHAIGCPASSITWTQYPASGGQYQTTTGWTHKPVVNRLHPDDLAELTEKVAERVVQMLRAKVL